MSSLHLLEKAQRNCHFDPNQIRELHFNSPTPLELLRLQPSDQIVLRVYRTDREGPVFYWYTSTIRDLYGQTSNRPHNTTLIHQAQATLDSGGPYRPTGLSYFLLQAIIVVYVCWVWDIYRDPGSRSIRQDLKQTPQHHTHLSSWVRWDSVRTYRPTGLSCFKPW